METKLPAKKKIKNSLTLQKSEKKKLNFTENLQPAV